MQGWQIVSFAISFTSPTVRNQFPQRGHSLNCKASQFPNCCNCWAARWECRWWSTIMCVADSGAGLRPNGPTGLGRGALAAPHAARPRPSPVADHPARPPPPPHTRAERRSCWDPSQACGGRCLQPQGARASQPFRAPSPPLIFGIKDLL